MRNAGCRRTKAHAFAEIIAPLGAKRAVATVDASLYRNALTDCEAGNSTTDGGDEPGCLVAQNEGCPNSKIAVATVGEIVDVAAAQACSDDLDLDIAC